MKHICSNLKNGEDYALFGYSMGALATYELIKLINMERKLHPPKWVFLAAHKPPCELGGDSIAMDDDKFIDYLVSEGGISGAISNDELFKEIFLPIIRNDYKIIGAYNYSPFVFSETSIPVTILYGKNDDNGNILMWDKCLNRRCMYKAFPGGHFFINNCLASICEVINYVL